MADMNSVNLVGRITKDLELKQAGETSVTSFSLAVNRAKKGEADFINCKAFGKTAETMAQYLGKGKPVAITGRIQTGKYDKDGKTIYTTDVIVDRFYFISGGAGEKHDGAQVAGIPGDYFGDNGMTQVDDGEDMPF